MSTSAPTLRYAPPARPDIETSTEVVRRSTSTELRIGVARWTQLGQVVLSLRAFSCGYPGPGVNIKPSECAAVARACERFLAYRDDGREGSALTLASIDRTCDRTLDVAITRRAPGARLTFTGTVDGKHSPPLDLDACEVRALARALETFTAGLAGTKDTTS